MYNHPELTATFASKGALKPLNEFINLDKEFDVEDFNAGLVEANTIGGKIYSLPTFSGPWMFVYNRDLIEPLGMGDPWELFQAGEWTIDKYREMAAASVTGEGQDKIFGTNEIPSAMKLIYLWAWGFGGGMSGTTMMPPRLSSATVPRPSPPGNTPPACCMTELRPLERVRPQLPGWKPGDALQQQDRDLPVPPAVLHQDHRPDQPRSRSHAQDAQR